MPKYPIRPVNALIAGYSYLRSSLTGNPEILGMPVTISTELTNYCNLGCPECINGSGQMTRDRGFMEPGLFEKIIDELHPYLLNINLYFQGEPMLHPDLFSFLAKTGGMNTVISTNGHYLNEENAEAIVHSGLTKLIVSLDGMDQETYESYRVGGNLGTVMRCIEAVHKAKIGSSSSMKLEIQFLVNRHNEHQIPQVRHYAGRMGASLRLKSMQIINSGSFTHWLPGQRKFNRYSLKGNDIVIKNRFPDRCARLWFNPVITWDGKVLPCCFDKDARYVMGDLSGESFRDIWYGRRYKGFRRSILTGRNMIDMCRNCTSGLRGIKC